MNESAALKKVINTVRGKKPEERKPQKAMDAGARGRRLYREESIGQRYPHSYQKS